MSGLQFVMASIATDRRVLPTILMTCLMIPVACGPMTHWICTIGFGLAVAVISSLYCGSMPDSSSKLSQLSLKLSFSRLLG